jgi:hypothetical protein
MKPIKAYILQHRRDEQTRVRPWTFWIVLLAATVAVVAFVWQIW